MFGKNWERMYNTEKEMRNHYEELFTAGVGELKFSNMQASYLMSVLEEIKEVTDDEMVKAVIENAVNRANLDKLIHIRELFPNNG